MIIGISARLFHPTQQKRKEPNCPAELLASIFHQYKKAERYLYLLKK